MSGDPMSDGRAPSPRRRWTSWRWLALIGLAVASLAVLGVVLGDGATRGGSSDAADRAQFCSALAADFGHHLDLAGGEHWGDGTSRDLRRTMDTFTYSSAFVRGAPPSLRSLAERVQDDVLTLDPDGRDRARASEAFDTLVRRARSEQACPEG